MSKGLIDTILDNIFDAEFIGKHGERLTARELKWVKLFGRKGKTLRNIYIPKDNGETSEIDVIYITRKGIFVFESKNYSGWIFGDEKQMNWTVMLPNKLKNRFYNPIKQNKTHIKWLGKYAGDDIPLFSIIVFSERCELKKVTVESEDVKVIKRDRTYATVRDIWDSRPDVVSDEMINELYAKLSKLTKVDNAIKAAHVENIEKKYKQPKKSVKETDTEIIVENIDLEDTIKDDSLTTDCESISENVEEMKETLSDENNLVCPKCGSMLILRTAAKGKNKGNQFYGCSSFPKCRYIQNITN